MIALLSGILFGFGLGLSEMINPQKVLGFLTVTEQWDPSLAFVMMGALFVAMLGFYLAGKRAKPFFEGKFHVPTRVDIDNSLVVGAACFGIGWGITGYCPGPVIASLGLGMIEPFIMLVAICCGFLLHIYLYENSR